MILTEEQRKEFEEKVKPLMEFLCKEFHPHIKIIIEPTRAEILEESLGFPCDNFVRD